MIRMKHPDHGFHHVYSSVERDEMVKNGWKDDVPEAEQESPENPDQTRTRAKPGPKPKIVE